MNTPRLTALFALAAGAPLVGQIPAHATVLNPTLGLSEVLVLQDGDTVHALGRGGFSVLHARSRDGGRTWPVREVPIGPYNAGQGFAAAIGMPGTVMALANDSNTGPTFWRSADEGTTWSTGTALASVVSPPGVGATALLVDGLDVTAVWVQNGGEVTCRRSLDDGVSWLPEQRLSVPGTTNSGLSCHRNGTVLDVIWEQGYSTVHQRSSDGGATWLPAPRIVCGSGLVSSASNGADLLVALTTGIFWRSTNGGASWTSITIPSHGLPMSMSHEGSRIAVTSLVGFPSSMTYALSVSSNGGSTWSPALLLPSPVYLYPSTLVARGTTYVAFPGLALDIVTSRDGGATWQLLDGPANFVSAGPSRNVNIVVAGVPLARFHAYVGLGSSVLGSATQGTGGIAPRLWGDGLPFQGATTTIRLDQAVGGSVAALGVSFATPAPVALGSATLWPTVAPIVLAIATGGGPGQAGGGSFAQPIAIPVASALVGTSFTSQALVVDGAAADGFTVSNALETWLR